MMKDFAKTTTIIANSVIENTVAVGMRATVNEDGTWNVMKNVRNTEVYLQNKEVCDADYEEFELKVLEAAKA